MMDQSEVVVNPSIILTRYAATQYSSALHYGHEISTEEVSAEHLGRQCNGCLLQGGATIRF